jgi:tRNA(adenine34) deaminase|tara:strand:+ start:3494 stop:3943 length:450 start_codon:yes stop_codon:yes gene_type:complete
MNDKAYMEKALSQAKLAFCEDEVPVGAVIVLDDMVIAESYNSSLKKLDASAHAEIEVLRLASLKVGNYRMLDSTMFVTLEPCMMCCGALANARVREVVFAARDEKSGAVISNDNLLDSSYLNHKVNYRQGPLASESAKLLKDFFINKRD